MFFLWFTFLFISLLILFFWQLWYVKFVIKSYVNFFFFNSMFDQPGYPGRSDFLFCEDIGIWRSVLHAYTFLFLRTSKYAALLSCRPRKMLTLKKLIFLSSSQFKNLFQDLICLSPPFKQIFLVRQLFIAADFGTGAQLPQGFT